MTYEDVADLSRWAHVTLWGLTVSLPSRAPLFVTLAGAALMDSEALNAIRRHNDYLARHPVRA